MSGFPTKPISVVSVLCMCLESEVGIVFALVAR